MIIYLFVTFIFSGVDNCLYFFLCFFSFISLVFFPFDWFLNNIPKFILSFSIHSNTLVFCCFFMLYHLKKSFPGVFLLVLFQLGLPALTLGFLLVVFQGFPLSFLLGWILDVINPLLSSHLVYSRVLLECILQQSEKVFMGGKLLETFHM